MQDASPTGDSQHVLPRPDAQEWEWTGTRQRAYLLALLSQHRREASGVPHESIADRGVHGQLYPWIASLVEDPRKSMTRPSLQQNCLHNAGRRVLSAWQLSSCLKTMCQAVLAFLWQRQLEMGMAMGLWTTAKAHLVPQATAKEALLQNPELPLVKVLWP